MMDPKANRARLFERRNSLCGPGRNPAFAHDTGANFATVAQSRGAGFKTRSSAGSRPAGGVNFMSSSCSPLASSTSGRGCAFGDSRCAVTTITYSAPIFHQTSTGADRAETVPPWSPGCTTLSNDHDMPEISAGSGGTIPRTIAGYQSTKLWRQHGLTEAPTGPEERLAPAVGHFPYPSGSIDGISSNALRRQLAGNKLGMKASVSTIECIPL